MTTSSPRFALLSYSTGNIGDEIQSLAARQFLPDVDLLLNRDRIGSLSRGLTTPTKMILNGWWLHGVDWPPSSSMLDPLLTSMFFDDRTPSVRDAVLAPQSREFLTSHGPVGARDRQTLEFLQAHGIPSYFSGCLTLTLRRDPAATREDYVLAVDVPERVLASLRARTARRVVSFSVDHDTSMPDDLRFRLAELYLLFYQSAACVVTTRLHALLPTLALDTPVLHVRDGAAFDARRLSGLVDLARSVPAEDLIISDGGYDLDDPPPNKEEHLVLREKLTRRCLDFTGRTSPRVNEVAALLRDPSNLSELAELVGDQAERGYRGGVALDRLEAPLRQRISRTARSALRRARGASRRVLKG